MMNINYFIAAFVLFTPQLSLGDEPSISIFPHPERIRYDNRCLIIDGKDTFIYSGAFHYFRCPQPLWPDRFQKMKDAGFNCVESYVPWNWHERQAPASLDDFSKVDLRELDDWITMAESYGFYVIIRPGPYICSEWSGGGFPQWLVPLEKPAHPLRSEMWLQTDDPVFLAWSKHWYDAVSAVVSKHQITHKSPGQPGVILFQIENEYNRLKFPNDVKENYLESLATDARQAGIDVPLFTCWTNQTRNAKTGPLHGIIDFVNNYPRWNVAKNLGSAADIQLKAQPDGPLMSMELQGGWYSAIAGKLSPDQDGIAPVQTQNLTLYALQRGFSLLNYYMLVGGTNFDDWASREATTTYDFAAAIGEDGLVNERYQRLQSIAQMLHEHGQRLIRSDLTVIHPTISDPKVEVAERVAEDGSRYFFVRTEDRSASHSGTVKIDDLKNPTITFDFTLEPFGSLIYYLPPGVTDHGQWLPKPTLPLQSRNITPPPIVITHAQCCSDPLPDKWTALAPTQFLEQLGVLDRHLIYYRITPPPGHAFTVSRIGDHVIKSTIADGVLAQVKGKLLPPTTSDKSSITFTMPPDGKDAILLFESVGLHQHTSLDVEQHWPVGIQSIIADSSPLPLQFSSTERDRGLQLSAANDISQFNWTPVEISVTTPPAPDALLTWYRIQFDLPEKDPAPVPRHLHLEANGNGFIYLNNHCVGRYWQIGPQHDFYLPECWLNPGKKNAIAVSLRPLNHGVAIHDASIVPNTPSGLP